MTDCTLQLMKRLNLFEFAKSASFYVILYGFVCYIFIIFIITFNFKKILKTILKDLNILNFQNF